MYAQKWMTPPAFLQWYANFSTTDFTQELLSMSLILSLCAE